MSSDLFKKGNNVIINPITDRTVHISWNRASYPYTPEYPTGMDPVSGSNSYNVFDGTTMIRAQIQGVINADEKSGQPIIVKVNNIFVRIPSELRDSIVLNTTGGRRKNRRGTKKARRNRRRSSHRN